MEKTKRTIALFVFFAACIGIGISYDKIYLLHLTIPFLLGIFAYESYKEKKLPFLFEIRSLYVSPLFMIAIWYLVSLIWVENHFLAIKYLFYIGVGGIIISAVLTAGKGKNNQSQLVKIAGIVFTIEIVVALFEGFTSFRYPISPYSDLAHLFNREIAYDLNLPESTIAAIKNTPTGFHWNPNNLAATMLIILPFILFHKNKYIKFGLSIGAIIVILLTGSRGILIGLAVMSFFLFALYFTWRSRWISIAGIALLASLFIINHDYIKNNYSQKYREISTTAEAFNNYVFTDHSQVNDTSSIAVRQQLTRNGIEALKESKGLGVGAGNSVQTQINKGNTHHTFSMHNFWIEILVEGGVMAFLIWSLWYMYILYQLWMIVKREKDQDLLYFAKSSSLSLIGLSVGIISISSAVYFFPMWLLIGFSLLTIKNSQNKYQISNL
jgi:teichuronic acid biosynthesis protein TuaE